MSEMTQPIADEARKMFTTEAITIPITPMNAIPPRDERFRFVTAPYSAAAPNIPAAETNAAATEAPV